MCDYYKDLGIEKKMTIGLRVYIIFCFTIWFNDSFVMSCLVIDFLLERFLLCLGFCNIMVT